MSIVVFGSITWDVAAFAGRLPKTGETLIGDRYATGLGGKGANQAVAAARLGGDAAFFGRIARDDFGEAARAAVERAGIDPSGIAFTSDAATALGVILVGANGDNAIIQAPGANRTVDATDVARASEALKGAKAALFQLEVPLEATLAAARIARESGAIAILDPAPAPADGLPGSVWMAFDYVTPNEVEAETFAGFRPKDAESGKAAAERLVELGAPNAIVTMGPAGAAWASEGGGQGFLPARAVDAVDTVGAGDCFNGGLAVGLAEGMPLEAAIRFASAAAGLSTTRPGASESAPGRAEVDAIL